MKKKWKRKVRQGADFVETYRANLHANYFEMTPNAAQQYAWVAANRPHFSTISNEMMTGTLAALDLTRGARETIFGLARLHATKIAEVAREFDPATRAVFFEDVAKSLEYQNADLTYTPIGTRWEPRNVNATESGAHVSA